MINMADVWPTAAEMMTPEPITIDSEEQLSTALGLMRSHGIHELPVVKRGKLVGLLPYDSLGKRRKISLGAKVMHLMSVATTVPPRATLPEVAERILGAETHAACVVNPREGKLMGLVSATDIVRSLRKSPSLGKLPAREMVTPVTVIFREKDPCSSLFSSMKELEEHPAPVLDSRNNLVGSVGIGEVGTALWRPAIKGHKDAGGSQRAEDAQISSIMSGIAPTVPDDATVDDVIHQMDRQRTSSVFLMDGGRPMGVISHADVLSLVVRKLGTPGGTYVQVTGLGPGTDPSVLSDIDSIAGKALKRISHVENPIMLSLNLAPHSPGKMSNVTLHGRLYLSGGKSYYASRTEWDLVSVVAGLMDELERQVRVSREMSKEKKRTGSTRFEASTASTMLTDPELDRRLNSVLEGQGTAAVKRNRKR